MFGRIVHTLPCVITDINDIIAMDIKTHRYKQKMSRRNNMVYVMTFGVYASRDFIEKVVVILP